MTSSDIHRRLANAIQSDNPYLGSAELVEELEKTGASLDVVELILRFMETHPKEYFGSPGPLVHFVERFYRHGYEEELLKSLLRTPTAHTLWMLNRLVNGTKDKIDRNRYLDALSEAQTHPEADQSAREAAAEFLGYHK
jgi:hypothetical protein